MSRGSESGLSRRSFVGSVCPLIVGGLALPRLGLHPAQQDLPGFWSEFTPEEQRLIGGSIMAQDVENFIGRGLGCAEICLAVSCKFMSESDEWLDAAAVFSGGFGKGDLCGFLTGGLMAVGIAAGRLHQDRAAIKQYARPLKDEYWNWWTSRGSLRCSELRTHYEGSEQFLRMAQRATTKLERLIAAAR